MTKVISILKRNVARRGDKEAEQKLDVDVETFAHALVGIGRGQGRLSRKVTLRRGGFT